MNKKEKELRTAYRNVFSTLQGQKVLGHMLEQLAFYGLAVTEEQKATANYARNLLDNCGLWPWPGSGVGKEQIPKALFDGVHSKEE